LKFCFLADKQSLVDKQSLADKRSLVGKQSTEPQATFFGAPVSSDSHP
jgi:hypothetical protein